MDLHEHQRKLNEQRRSVEVAYQPWQHSTNNVANQRHDKYLAQVAHLAKLEAEYVEYMRRSVSAG